jgi:hypothetical protein
MNLGQQIPLVNRISGNMEITKVKNGPDIYPGRYPYIIGLNAE